MPLSSGSEWNHTRNDGGFTSHSEEPAGLLNNVPSVKSTPDGVQLTCVQVPGLLSVWLRDPGQVGQAWGVTGFPRFLPVVRNSNQQRRGR